MDRFWVIPLCVIFYVITYVFHWCCYPFIKRTHYTVPLNKFGPFPTMDSETKAIAEVIKKRYASATGKIVVSRKPTWQPDIWVWTFRYQDTTIKSKGLRV